MTRSEATIWQWLMAGSLTFAIGCTGGMTTPDGGDSAISVDATDAMSSLRMCLMNRGHDAGTTFDSSTTDAMHGSPDAGMDAMIRDVAITDATINDATVSGPMPVQISLGDEFSCVRFADETIQCWGANQDGEMADGTTNSRLNPAPVAGISGVLQVATGGRHACTRTSTGALRCWGRDLEGELGDGLEHFMPQLPLSVPCMNDMPEVALGAAHSCARSMLGAVACWGSNAYGQIGDGTQMDRALPTEVTGLNGAVGITLGNTHSCARMSDGTARCWGDNSFGQLGIGASMMSVSHPSTIAGLANVRDLVAGGYHSCAVLQNGTALCWGHNNAGQLGDGTMTDQTTPVAVSGLPAPILQIALGTAHTCARLMDSTVWCWGWNQSGQLGQSTSTIQPVPAQVAGITNAAEIATGGQHTCARMTDGTVACWGNNERGQIGDGTHNIHTSPFTLHWGL